MRTATAAASRERILVLAATVLAWGGFFAHNVREFGWSGVASLGTFTIPWTLLFLALSVLWWRGRARRAAARGLFLLAAVNLIGGAIISVLPLDFLPFEPEQTLTHYISHTIYGAAQLPLLWLMSSQRLPRP